MVKPERFSVLVALLTLIALGLRIWRLGEMPLFADEAYYLLWAQRLAPAYYDHGPGIAMLLKLSTWLGGNSELGVRWLNALMSAGCVPLSYALGRRYIHRAGGLIAAATVALAPGYVISGRVAYPDALQGALLLLSLLALAPFLKKTSGEPGQKSASAGDMWRWSLLGLILGLLLNIKLTSLFYLGALGVFVLVFRRDLLRRAGFWLAVGIAALLWTPYIAWNTEYGWTALRHALAQGGGFEGGRPGLLGRLVHAWRYLTPPVIGTAGLILAAVLARGFLMRRKSMATLHPAWLLLGCGACLTLPVLLSSADSPRNLGLGLLAVWPVAGVAWHSEPAGGATASKTRAAFGALFALLFIGQAIWAAGTVTALLGPPGLPHSSAASAIRQDAAGWPELASDLPETESGLIYAVDYSIAGQIAYYSNRPVTSSAGQFRIWGIPEFEDATIVAQGYLPPTLIAERLHADFEQVTEAITLSFADTGLKKVVYAWQATGRRVPMAQIVEDLDYLALARAASEGD